MILGIIALVLICIPYVSLPCAILAIIFGVIGKNKADRGEGAGRGMAMAGLITGIIAIALDIVMIILAIIGFSFFREEIEREMQRQQQRQQQQQSSALIRYAVDPSEQPNRT
jgi:hypothetical protein